MELRHLRYFLAVAEELNFRRAAEKLGMAQPPLSSQIHDLENEVGVLLFRRVPKGAELTEAGVAFLSAVPAIFDKVEHAVKVARKGGQGKVGQLRVGYTGSASFNQIVPRSLLAFRRSYPEVELTLEEANSPLLLDQLNRQRLDAVFIRPGKELPPGFAVMPLAEEPIGYTGKHKGKEEFRLKNSMFESVAGGKAEGNLLKAQLHAMGLLSTEQRGAGVSFLVKRPIPGSNNRVRVVAIRAVRQMQAKPAAPARIT